MKNFFFAADAAMKSRLQEAGIGFCDLDLDGVAGIVVEEEEIGRALEVIGARVAGESPSTLDGIFILTLSRIIPTPQSPVEYKVEVASWDGSGRDGFMKIVKEVLIPFVRMDVVLSVPHGKVIAPASDGKFHVWIWSAPAGEEKENFSAPEKIWGIGVDCRDSGFKPSGQGVPIMDAETGWAVGELVGNNLFVHHDLCHNGTDREISIFRRLCEEVATELSASPEEKAERQRRLAEAKRAKAREAYVAECSKRFEKTVAGTKEAVKKGHADIARLQQELTRRIRETQGAERKLEQIESLRGDHFVSYGREFDSLLSVPGVENVEIGDGVIKVFTEHIYITPDGCADTFDIGKFRMEIYTSGTNGGIRFFNLTRTNKTGGYNTHHPHVNSYGQPCLGNIKEMVPMLIGEAEYSAVAQIGLQYLKSVNIEDSAGRGIFDYWPKVEKKEA